MATLHHRATLALVRRPPGCLSRDRGHTVEAVADLFNWARPRWHADAACKEHPELTWVVSDRDSATRQLAICATCLVREECLAAAMAGDEVGIWGGTTELQRGESKPTQRARAADRVNLARQMAADGATVDEIAERFGCSRHAVYALLWRNGIKLATSRDPAA
jgi:Transcription factor WhiB/Homeodomain-like domain